MAINRTVLSGRNTVHFTPNFACCVLIQVQARVPENVHRRFNRSVYQMALSGWICVVTGASRGIGRGIALQLTEAGATVYITGRQEEGKPLKQTAAEVIERGGRCLPVVCDSSKEDEIKELFERVQREQKGRLDLLVNNAYAGVQAIMNNLNKKFWEVDPDIWDTINNTGLRGHYFCSVYAARMMVAQGKGLIVFISSMGGLRYLFNVSYGVGKAACDRMAADMAIELKKKGVVSVSLWPGAVQTELINQYISGDDAAARFDPKFKEMFRKGETTEFSGRCIAELAKDKNLMSMTGQVLMTCDLAYRYGLKDVDGRSIVDYTSLKFLISQVPYVSWLSVFTPSFIRVPRSMLSLGKF
ncbi:dehydrogenase/reductase SDR family member 1 [Cyprinus carpio]|uniref:Dehydrogenase/reductase SDR family member 1 n=1 Tax=Cyprinus carpio TaxID=7962 RepID=A0A9Q9W0J9_CYPCA|nr:dehydrogenase/reductase SDR family member 1 [Cyprinus carpio]